MKQLVPNEVSEMTYQLLIAMGALVSYRWSEGVGGWNIFLICKWFLSMKMGTLIPTVLPQINQYSLLYLDSKSLTTNISRVCVTYIIVGVSLVFLCQLRSFGSSEAEEQSELTLLNLVTQNLQLTCALELLQLFICQLLHKQLYISLSHWENPGWLYSYNT